MEMVRAPKLEAAGTSNPDLQPSDFGLRTSPVSLESGIGDYSRSTHE